MFRPDGARRGVQDRRRVKPDVTALRGAGKATAARDGGIDIALGDAAEPVRSRRDPQWGVVVRYGIEMDAHRQHRVEQGEGRIDMGDAGLDRPGAEAGRLAAFAHCDGAVLCQPCAQLVAALLSNWTARTGGAAGPRRSAARRPIGPVSSSNAARPGMSCRRRPAWSAGRPASTDSRSGKTARAAPGKSADPCCSIVSWTKDTDAGVN